MKSIAGLLAILFTATGWAQVRSFGSVVFPGGTAATTPGVTRNFGSVVFPGGVNMQPVRTSPATIPPRIATPPFGTPAGQTFRRNNGQPFVNGQPFGGHQRQQNTLVYAYPVFIGGYGGGYGGYDYPMMSPDAPPPAPMPQPAQMMSSYPQETARPVIIQVLPDNNSRPIIANQAPPPGDAQEPAPSGDRYLLAFKDHSVYSAVAYWFDGDTLHYFTSGNLHNQASVSLLDRELTLRLNRELGIDFRMPDKR